MLYAELLKRIGLFFSEISTLSHKISMWFLRKAITEVQKMKATQ